MIIFWEKNLCHTRDSNHRSPVFRTGALTTSATVTRLPTRKQISLSYKFQTRTLVNVTCYYSFWEQPTSGYFSLDLLIYRLIEKKTPTTLSMLCRTANWSLFNKEPMSENARCGRSRTSKSENWCHSFWSPKQVCNPLAIDVGAITFLRMHYSFILNEVRSVVFECSERFLAAFDMYQYKTAEMTDMVLAYGKADCKDRAAARLYAERFPNRHTPHYSSFAAIERRLREAGKFHVCT